MRLTRNSFPLRRSSLVSFAGIALVGSLVGCVPQSKYDDLMTGYRSKEQQVLTLQGDLDTARSNEEALRLQLAQAAADLDEAKRLVAAGGGNVDELQRRYEALLAKVNELDRPVLGEKISAELQAVADANPDVFEFDAKRGMIRFKSDVTFDSGKATLSARAQEVIRKIAPILNSSGASNLEVKVVGHTDSQPIRSSAKDHPTNIHLSAHRAIAVRDALVQDGVAPARFQVAGYGEFRPIVQNTPSGARENRRVELFLTPGTWDIATNMPPGTGGGAAPVRANKPIAPQPRANANEEPTK
ncbi:MAG: OmpA family protein [Phycisphaerales bacterium]